jgi:hypothetical protein
MFNTDPKRAFSRVIFIALGVSAIGFGLAPLRHGYLFYQNGWGGVVFGPLAILFGVLFIVCAIFERDIFKLEVRQIRNQHSYERPCR